MATCVLHVLPDEVRGFDGQLAKVDLTGPGHQRGKTVSGIMMQPTGNHNFSLTCVLGSDFTLAGSTVETNVRLEHPAIIAYHAEDDSATSMASFTEIKDEQVLFLDVAKAFLQQFPFFTL